MFAKNCSLAPKQTPHHKQNPYHYMHMSFCFLIECRLTRSSFYFVEKKDEQKKTLATKENVSLSNVERRKKTTTLLVCHILWLILWAFYKISKSNLHSGKKTSCATKRPAGRPVWPTYRMTCHTIRCFQNLTFFSNTKWKIVWADWSVYDVRSSSPANF